MGIAVTKTRAVIRRLGDLRLATDLRMRFLIPLLPLLFTFIDGWFAKVILLPAALVIAVAACALTVIEMILEFRSANKKD
jgi:hypothetical protein